MIVKDILFEAVNLLGEREHFLWYLDGEDYDYEPKVEQLLSCLHLTECSLALDYFPLYAEDELLSSTGRLEFSDFTHAPVQIMEVKNSAGAVLPYTLYPTYLKTSAGRLKVTYTYTPAKKGIEDECEFGDSISMHILVYGTLAKYCLANGMYQEAAAWDKKKKETVEYFFKIGKNKKLASRRWI